MDKDRTMFSIYIYLVGSERLVGVVTRNNISIVLQLILLWSFPLLPQSLVWKVITLFV